jgi:hypothetical protein
MHGGICKKCQKVRIRLYDGICFRCRFNINVEQYEKIKRLRDLEELKKQLEEPVVDVIEEPTEEEPVSEDVIVEEKELDEITQPDQLVKPDNLVKSEKKPTRKRTGTRRITKKKKVE